MPIAESPTMAKRTKLKLPSTRKRNAARGTARRADAGPPAAPIEPAAGAGPVVAAAGDDAAVRIRFYCQGIGDCHLLRFKKPDGFFWMLIDCGIHSSVK